MTMKQGDTAMANGWPAIVLSAPKGERIMCIVYGYHRDIGDVYLRDVRPVSEAWAVDCLFSQYDPEEFKATVAKNQKEYAKKQAARERKAAKKVA